MVVFHQGNLLHSSGANNRTDARLDHPNDVLLVSTRGVDPRVDVFHEGHVEAERGDDAEASMAGDPLQAVVEADNAQRKNVVWLYGEDRRAARFDGLCVH